MKQSVNFFDFCRAFELSGRNKNFSYEGKRALFDYLEEFEEDTGEEIELDVIAICCDWCEYGSAVEAMTELSEADIEGDDEDEREEYAKEWLYNNGNVVEFDEGIICSNH